MLNYQNRINTYTHKQFNIKPGRSPPTIQAARPQCYTVGSGSMMVTLKVPTLRPSMKVFARTETAEA